MSAGKDVEERVKPVDEGLVLKNFYTVNPPYAHIAIYYDERTGSTVYKVIEPLLTGKEVDALNEIKEIMLEEARLELGALQDIKRARILLEIEVRRIIREYGVKVHPASLGKLVYYVVRDFVGYERIDPMYRDPYVEDIVCLPGDEALMTPNGPIEVSSLFDELAVREQAIDYPCGLSSCETTSSIRVSAVDVQGLTVRPTPIRRAFKRPALEGRLSVIETDKGVVRVTPGHLLAVLEGSAVSWRRASKVKRGGRLIWCLGGDLYTARVVRTYEEGFRGFVYDFKTGLRTMITAGGALIHNCDGVGIPIYVYHRNYEWMPTNVVFPEWEGLEKFVRRLAYRAGQSITYARPIVEGPLMPEGFRAHLTLKEVSRRGSTFTIRKYSMEPLTIIDLLNFRTLSPRIAALIWLAIDAILSMLIAGPMASGKTTLLNAISMLIRPEVKIVTIEDTPELRLPHENWVPLITRPSFEPGVQDITLYDLLKSALRQRPEYIIVGEIRGEEAYTFFQAMALGHGGLCTIHGEDVDSVLARLSGKPMNIPKNMLPLAKMILLMGRVKGRRGIERRVLSVTELVGYDPRTDQVIVNDLFKWNPIRDDWEYSGRSHVVEYIAKKLNRPVDHVLEDWDKRTVILKWMAEMGLSKFHQVADITRRFYTDPERVYAMALAEVGAP